MYSAGTEHTVNAKRLHAIVAAYDISRTDGGRARTYLYSVQHGTEYAFYRILISSRLIKR